MSNQINKNNKFNLIHIVIVIFFILFLAKPFFAILFLIGIFFIAFKNKKSSTFITNYLQNLSKFNNISIKKINLINNINKSIINTIPVNNEGEGGNEEEISSSDSDTIEFQSNRIFTPISAQTRLKKRNKYLHIALNNTIEEARSIISQLPFSERILIEVGTPLIKIHGIEAILQIKNMVPSGTYIVADNKCADLGAREVEIMANAGANASTCLGVSPIETIDIFIEECRKYNIDSIIDMMNVEDVLSVLKKLKNLPDVVMLHRGVDESEFSKEKQIPYYQIKQIKGNYNILVAVAGGDTIKEVQRALFNDADIVVVWKNFYQANTETAKLADSFLKEIQ